MIEMNESQEQILLECVESMGFKDLTKAGRVRLPSGTLSIENFLKKIDKISLIKKDPGFMDIVSNEEDFFNLVGEFLQSVVDSRKDEVKPSGNLPKNEFFTEEYNLEIQKYVRSLVPVMNPKKAKEIVLYNPETRRIELDFDADIYFIITGTNPKEVGSTQIGFFEFNPFVLEGIYETPASSTNLSTKKFLNLYRPPQWRLHEDQKAEYPELIKILIEHLFPDEEVREYIFNWMYNAIMHRNQTYLCLNGNRGIGKGVFSELIAALVGNEYSEVVGESLLEDKFNFVVRNKRLIILDEVDVNDPDKINRLKAMANNFIAMEGKGVDQTTERNFNSFIISMNNLDGLHIGPEERRFSVPEMTNVKLNLVMAEEDIQNLTNECSNNPDSEIIRQFGNWIIANGKSPKYSEFSAWKKEHFYKVSYASLAEWKRYLVDNLPDMAGQTVKIKDISTKFYTTLGIEPGKSSVKFPVSPASIGKFLDDYLYKGEIKMGEIVKIEDKVKGRGLMMVNAIQVSSLLSKEEKISDEEDKSDEQISEDLDSLL